MSRLVAAIACAGALALSNVALARAETAAAPVAIAASLSEPRLAGEGVMRWFGLTIYEARLWTRPEGLDPRKFPAAAFALELRYARSLDGESIARASHDEIAKLGFGDARRRAAWLDSMRRIFPSVGDGDRITGVHRPGSGASFYLNDRRIGSVDDPEFSDAFFAIWLDPRTSEPALRERLLARFLRASGASR